MAGRIEFFTCCFCLKILPAIRFDMSLIGRFQKQGPAMMGERSLRKCTQCRILGETDFRSGMICCWTPRVTTYVVPAREAARRNNRGPHDKDGENSKPILTWNITNLLSQLLFNFDLTSQAARSPTSHSEQSTQYPIVASITPLRVPQQTYSACFFGTVAAGDKGVGSCIELHHSSLQIQKRQGISSLSASSRLFLALLNDVS